MVEALGKPGVQLLTLTGSGGIGATRLAEQAAARLLDFYRHRVFLCDLAPLADPAELSRKIASALGVLRSVGDPRSIPELLRDYLGEKELLLVLDNSEHLLAAALPGGRASPFLPRTEGPGYQPGGAAAAGGARASRAPASVPGSYRVHEGCPAQRSGEGSEARQRFASCLVALAEEAEPKLYGPEQVVWLDRLDQRIRELPRGVVPAARECQGCRRASVCRGAGVVLVQEGDLPKGTDGCGSSASRPPARSRLPVARRRSTTSGGCT